MTQPQWDDAQASMPPAKRPKLFRACATCVASKTRCEDVTSEGCSLCRRRHRVCSLARAASALEAAAAINGPGPTTGGSSAARTPGPTVSASGSPRGSLHAHPSPILSRPASAPWSHGSASASANANANVQRSSGQHSQGTYPPPHAHQHAAHSHHSSGALVDSAEIEELRGRLAEAERRVARTETALFELEARFERESRELELRDADRSASHMYPHSHSQAHAHAHGQAQAHSVEEPLPRDGPLRLTTSGFIPHDETLFSVASTRPFPDPVMRGVISAANVELAWHGFKARISALIPLPPFLAVSTPVPAHGFVVIAALHHVPSTYSPALALLTAECLMHAMAGAASIDVVLALLILSLAPERPDNERANMPPESANDHQRAPRPLSPYRLIALAYSIGQNIGLETTAEAALRRGKELNHDCWREQLWRLQLWAAVVNRYALLSLMYGQTVPPTRLTAARLPTLQRDSVEACNRHLRAEAELVELFRPTAMTLSRLEHRDDDFPLEILYALYNDLNSAVDGVNAFIGTGKPPPICNDAKCIEFALGLRCGSLAFWIPTPFQHAREAALRCLHNFPATMRSMFDVLLGSNTPNLAPEQLPAYAVHVMSTALLCFRRAVHFVAITYPNAPPLIPVEQLDHAESTLRRLGHSQRFLFHHAEQMFQRLPGWKIKWAGLSNANKDAGEARGCAGAQGATKARESNGPFAPVDPADDSGPNPAIAGAAAALFDLDFMNWDLGLLYSDMGAGQVLPPNHLDLPIPQ